MRFDNVVIAGVGMTRFGRFPETSTRALAQEATNVALADAGVTAREVDSVIYGNALAGLLQGQEMIRSEVAFRGTDMAGLPMLNVENACASGSSAVHVGALTIAAGAADVVVVVGAEKLSHPDRQRTADALGSATDLACVDQTRAAVGSSDPASPLMMDIYADLTRRYVQASGATLEDFARVTVKNRWFATRNPVAQFRSEVTVQDVLASRSISDPLTLLMCSPTGDGAAAVVLMSRERAARSTPDRPLVSLRASAVATAAPDESEGESVIQRAATRAFNESGLGAKDASLIEVHDAAAPGELIAYEEIGLCDPGEGAALLRRGETSRGGSTPVNTSGGLLGRGHPVGATGCAQLVELVQQLRGESGERQVEGARVGIAENHGGYLHPEPAVAVVSVLSRDDL